MIARRPAARALLLLALCAAAAAPAAAAPAGPGTAPAFRVRAVDGRTVELAALLARGPVVLDFWATWCRPCEHSLPGAQRLYERLRERGVTVVGVSIDGPRNWARVRPFAARLGLSFPIVIDEDGSLARRYQVQAVPAAVVIAPDGRIDRVRTGYVPGSDEALESAVIALLADSTGAGAP